uniref:Uncharacterized protein n=1 Tax=Cajanus cajan TaxID=3821 RepID=A0A151U9U1_CAJCA|nr:hypothetical protein KK1_020313 [Cajanus cajan]
MILVEIGEPSFRRAHFDEASNEAELRTNLDTAEEIRDRALGVAEATKQHYKRRFGKQGKLILPTPETILQRDKCV